jgi:hypothetical protein
MFKEKFETWINRKKHKNQPVANGGTQPPTERSVTPSKKPALSQKQTTELQNRQRQRRQPFRQQQPVSHKISKASGLDSWLVFKGYL